MISEGIDIYKTSTFFDSHKPYDETFKANIHAFLKAKKHVFSNSLYKKIIILDDGGELIEEIEKYISDSDINKIVAVEQTSSGYHKLKDKDLKIPVVNMALSKAKLCTEYDKISQDAFEKVLNFILENDLCISNVLILGNGMMGQTIEKQLMKNKIKAKKFDPQKNLSDISDKQLDEYISQADLIIGCSGQISLPNEKHYLLKDNVVLASLSSSDREFDAIYLRKKCKNDSFPWKNRKCGNVHLLNSGFPVNFNNVNTDDLHFFQFTRALIMTSIYQSLRNSGLKGLIELDPYLQNNMLKKFNDLNINYLLENKNSMQTSVCSCPQ